MVAFFFMVMTLITSMCVWTNDQVLFTHKENQELQIIKRSYECGALDSGPPNVKIFKIKKYTNYFIFVKKVEIKNITQPNGRKHSKYMFEQLDNNQLSQTKIKNILKHPCSSLFLF